MVEGAVHKASKAEFLDLFRLARRKPYIILLAVSAALGGFLFGYDTGVISGASLYIREDFPAVRKNEALAETIVSMTPAGAIFGAALGGWMNDRFGRKKAIITADIVFAFGAIVMAAAQTPWFIIIGRFIVGLGVGIASMTAPLYISEASPTKVRGALVSFNGLMITGGQFLAYLINLYFTHVRGTWRWMLGIAAVPAVLQLILMCWLPESPRWDYRKNKKDKAMATLKKISPEEELDEAVEALKASVDAEIALRGGSLEGGKVFTEIKEALKTSVFRRGLAAGIGVQVVQQFVGINTVMYYSPTIIQLAGIASNSTAIALSLITSGLNAIGSIVSMMFVDKFGRKKLMIISLFGIIFCLGGLAVMFKVSDAQAPKVDGFETARFGNNTCPAYIKSSSAGSWSCRSCLDLSNNDCAFCSNSANPHQPGACIHSDSTSKTMCQSTKKSQFFTQGCPSKSGIWAIVFLALYIISYSPGMGTAPWIVNSEIYPLRFRGIGGGMAATSNWIANVIVSQTFLSLIRAVGASYTFVIFASFSFLGLVYICWVVPETKGLSLEDMENMLEGRNVLQPWKNEKKNLVGEEKGGARL